MLALCTVSAPARRVCGLRRLDLLTRHSHVADASGERPRAIQVVLDLAGAVKELVENALDAGATTVEARVLRFMQRAYTRTRQTKQRCATRRYG